MKLILFNKNLKTTREFLVYKLYNKVNGIKLVKMRVKRGVNKMEVILEQFIPSDKPKRISNLLKNLAITFAIIGLLIIFGLFIIGIALEIVALAFFIGSYLMYIDYEYELYNGNISITKVYNASRRKIAQTINKDEVKRVYSTERKDALKKNVLAFYNTNLDGLKIYTFELNNNKRIQVALNKEMEKMIKIIYSQAMTF